MLLLVRAYRLLRECRQAFTRLDTPPLSNRRHPGSAIAHKEIEHYGADIAYYSAMRPGLIGLWQVSGRNSTTYRRRVQLDKWYVKNWTLRRDIVIFAVTVPAVLKRTGAV